MIQDANVKKLIGEQTAQWSAMIERQNKEEWELLKNQTESARDELKRLIQVVQATQVKQMQAKQDRSVLRYLTNNDLRCFYFYAKSNY